MRVRWEIIAVITLSMYLVWLGTGQRWSIWLGGDPEIAVKVVGVKRRVTPVTFLVKGTIVPAGEIEVVSRLAGRVIEVRFRVGQRVAAGAVVATVDAHDIAQRRGEIENSLAAARAELQEKEQSLAAAEKLAARTRELFKQDLIARVDLEQVEAALQTARAQYDLARAQFSQQESMLAQARKIQSLAQITAPVAGSVTQRWVEPGATIAQSSKILSIGNPGALKFSGRMTGELPSGVREGLSASITSAAVKGAKLDGKLTRVDRRAENGETISEFEIQIKNSTGDFHSGMAADAVIPLDREEIILLVPRTAVFTSSGKDYLFKLNAGRAIRQEIKLGAAQNDEIAVNQGVDVSDLVITGDVSRLKPGSRVRVPDSVDR
jgi:RND family efflux transporter MFP subunit